MSIYKKGKEPGFWATLSSLQFGIIVLIAISVTAIIGTLIPQDQTAEFYREKYGSLVYFIIESFRFYDTYHSPLFTGLIALFGLNLILCSVRRFPSVIKKAFSPEKVADEKKILSQPFNLTIKCNLGVLKERLEKEGFKNISPDSNQFFSEKNKIGFLGALIVHISLLLFIIGGLLSLTTGFRGYIPLHEGESTGLINVNDVRRVPLGFDLKLDKFEVEFYENHPGRPKSYTSYVTIKDNKSGEEEKKSILVNHPLFKNGFTIYQSSYGMDNENKYASDNDTAFVDVRIKNVPDDVPPIVSLAMVKGQKYNVPGFGDSLSISIKSVDRNFSMEGGRSSDPNPAVKINVTINNKEWNVYAFQNFPGLNMPMNEEMKLLFSLKDIKSGEVNSPDEPLYYSVLGVTKDRGIPFMLAGALLMMLGFILSFYFRPMRIWAIEKENCVMIGAAIKGESDSFRELLEEFKDKEKGRIQ